MAHLLTRGGLRHDDDATSDGTIFFVDTSCALYCNLFGDVRSFDHLHLRQRRLQLTRHALRGRSFEMRQLWADESARAANECRSGMSFADGFRCI